MKKLNLPNKLTILRFILTPLLILLMLFRYDRLYEYIYDKGFFGYTLDIILYIIVLFLFVLIALTDFLDGYLARRDNLITNFGKLMDPIADKVFVFSILIVFVKYDLVSVWFVIILLAREFVVVAVRTLIVENNGSIVAASNLAKLKTLTQMLAIFLILILPGYKLINSLIILPSVILSVISMIEYLNMAKEYLWKE